MHLTNYSVNKTAADYVKNDHKDRQKDGFTSKWNLNDLKEFLTTEGYGWSDI
jgi:hypothetical protein